MGFIECMVKYGVHVRFWPTLEMSVGVGGRGVYNGGAGICS